MTKYWCVNFDSDSKVCLQHGLERKLWLMQYQYEDDQGNVFQGGRQKGATTRIWRRMKEISAGDKFVAYLKGNKFYAVGTVIEPRESKAKNDRVDTIESYVERKRSHDHVAGRIFYTPVFYEDFDDPWRHPDDSQMRYAQRIDVDEWKYFVPNGVSVNGLNRIPPHELQMAAFQIPKDFFEQITKKLAAELGMEPEEYDAGVVDVADDTVAEAIERSYARGQGFQLDSKTRKALEDYAMEAARNHFVSQGYVVEDYSMNHPYDLLCTKDSKRLHVEVKGTQTRGEDIILTNGEVNFARSHKESMALFVLYSIKIAADGTLSGGQKRVIVPWEVDAKSLKPISFMYRVPS